MNKLETGDHLHDLETRLENCRMGEVYEWHESGKIFHTINELKYWQFGYASFKAYCAAHKYAPSTAYNRVLVHKTFIEGELVASVKDLYPVDVTKLVKIAPYVDGENVKDFLYSAETLTMTDLTKWMIDKGHKVEKPASHEACVMVVWRDGWALAPEITCHDDPGAAKVALELESNLRLESDPIHICANLYHLGKGFPLNYQYRDGRWTDDTG